IYGGAERRFVVLTGPRAGFHAALSGVIWDADHSIRAGHAACAAAGCRAWLFWFFRGAFALAEYGYAGSMCATFVGVGLTVAAAYRLVHRGALFGRQLAGPHAIPAPAVLRLLKYANLAGHLAGKTGDASAICKTRLSRR